MWRNNLQSLHGTDTNGSDAAETSLCVNYLNTLTALNYLSLTALIACITSSDLTTLLTSDIAPIDCPLVWFQKSIRQWLLHHLEHSEKKFPSALERVGSQSLKKCEYIYMCLHIALKLQPLEGGVFWCFHSCCNCGCLKWSLMHKAVKCLVKIIDGSNDLQEKWGLGRPRCPTSFQWPWMIRTSTCNYCDLHKC